VEIRVERAKLEDAELILQGQQKSFLPLLERYQDHDVNPCNEKLESIQKSIIEHYFYKILVDEKFSGAIYVHENPDDLHFKLHTIYILPEYQNRGIGQKAIEYVEKIHSCALEWVDTLRINPTKNTANDMWKVYQKIWYTFLACYRKSSPPLK
jgi:GNAT superfamily N-acetyltransferase